MYLVFFYFLGWYNQGGLNIRSLSALFDLNSEFNAIHPIFTKKLGFMMQTTNIGTQKINSTTFETYKIVIASF